MEPPVEALSLVVIQLMKGVVYAEEDEPLWNSLVALQSQVRDYVKVMGLELSLAEDEGVAWLTSRRPREGEYELPRLVHKRQLSYPVSLLLALLRRRLAEHDASSGDQRLIVTKESLVEQLRILLPVKTNEVRWHDQIDNHLNKIAEMGFIRHLRQDDSKFEIKRILKAFIDAQWLDQFDRRLSEYVEKYAQDNEE